MTSQRVASPAELVSRAPRAALANGYIQALYLLLLAVPASFVLPAAWRARQTGTGRPGRKGSPVPQPHAGAWIAAAAALVSSLAGAPLRPDCVFFGEVSLSGAVRPVSHRAQRLREAEKLGFARAMAPERGVTDDSPAGLDITALGELDELVSQIAASGPRAGRSLRERLAAAGAQPAEPARASGHRRGSAH